MVCDMCGSEGKLYRTIIEGTELNVCHECSKYGKVIAIIKEEVRKVPVKQEKEIPEVVVEDFADRIKKKREESGLTQKDFAKKINEKESIIHKIETGGFAPPLGLAKKIGKFLHIKLVENQEEGSGETVKSKMGSFTLGDFIKKN